MVKKLTQELKHRQDTGAARASASQVLEDFKEVLAQQKISIGKSTLHKYVAKGTINKSPKKRGGGGGGGGGGGSRKQGGSNRKIVLR